MNKSQKIAELKIQYPKLTKFVNNEIFELDAEEYELKIAEWAEIELSEQAEAEAKAQAKAALLAQLGITEEQAKLLLS